ncbi:MAG: zinc ribbon domain-containing protein [Pseudomonadota bacterium]
MPIYEYACQACGRSFEELIRGKADEEELCCPSCKGKDLVRELSVFGVQGNVSKPITGGSSCGGCSGGSCSSCH